MDYTETMKTHTLAVSVVWFLVACAAVFAPCQSPARGADGTKLVIFPVLADEGFSQSAEFSGDAAFINKTMLETAQKTGAFSEIIMKPVPETNDDSEVALCGGADGSVCLAGMAMEDGANYIMYAVYTRIKKGAPPVLTLVLGETKTVTEINRLVVLIEDSYDFERLATNGICELLSSFGCATKPVAAVPPAVPADKGSDQDILYTDPGDTEVAASGAADDFSDIRTSVAAKPESEISTSTILNITGIVVTSIGGAVLIGGGTTWLLGHLEYQKYQDATTPEEALSAKENVKDYMSYSTILGITGGVIAVAGATMLIVAPFLEPKEEESLEAFRFAPYTNGTSTGISVQGKF